MAGSVLSTKTCGAADDASRRLYPKLFVMWSEQGLSPRAASALALAGCSTIEQVSALGRAYFTARPNVGAKTMAELARLAGWPDEPKTPAQAIATALRLSMSDPEDAEEAAIDCCMSLRRAGYVIVAAKRSAPAGCR